MIGGWRFFLAGAIPNTTNDDDDAETFSGDNLIASQPVPNLETSKRGYVKVSSRNPKPNLYIFFIICLEL